ncbi:MAG TPA: DUF4097 family beta strand repeat-containing protein [Vicinamibacterales bacterium]|nr:DUF4097 family beta strand repeat-containing protein [Vicinamibacterales bacterium]
MHRFKLLLLIALTAVTLTAAIPARAASAPADHPRGVDPHARAAWLEHYQDSRRGPEQTERFTQSYKVGADSALDLQNLSGNVRVTAARGNEIRIEATKRVRHREADEAKRLLGELRIDVSQVGNRLEVRTIYPRMSGRGGLSASVDYVISVPANTAVALKTISGDVTVADVHGEVRAETTSGNVDVSATPNLASAKTISGNVTARSISAPATLTLGTVSGSVIASALKVRAIDAGTVSGNVQLTDVHVERVDAKSVSGDIEFDARLAQGGRYAFNSHSGNVRIVLSGAPGFELDASTFSGSIRSDFPVTMRSTADSSGRDRRGLNRAIRGTYGDASAILSVRSFSGNVVITKK